MPTLIIHDGDKEVTLTESLPICEYIEEVYPDTRKLIPADPLLKFKVRRLCEMVNAGIQPIQNLGVLQELGSKFGAEHKLPWGKWVIERGLDSKLNI